MRLFNVINNKKSIEWGLNIQCAYLFSCIYELQSCQNKVIIGNDVYYFASKSKIVEELPLLTDKVDTVYRYLKILEEKGLIVLKKIDSKDYIALTEKSKSWNF